MPSNRAILVSQAQYLQCGISCATLKDVLLKPHVFGIQIIQFRLKEVGSHIPLQSQVMMLTDSVVIRPKAMV